VLARDTQWDPHLHRPYIAALFRTRARDESALRLFSEWMTAQEKTEHAAAWFTLLKSEQQSGPDPHLAGLALASFLTPTRAATLPSSYEVAWKRATSADRQCLVETGKVFLKTGRYDWAWKVTDALRDVVSGLGSRSVTLSVAVAAARKDEAGIQTAFDDVMRQAIPGGRDTVQWAAAFEAAGRQDMAGEILSLALSRVGQTFMPSAELVKEYVRLLQRQQRFEEAELLLVQYYPSFMAEAAQMIVDLYRTWNRMDRLDKELEKYFLPLGVEREVKFLASRQ
jgi:hypothetical protein